MSSALGVYTPISVITNTNYDSRYRNIISHFRIQLLDFRCRHGHACLDSRLHVPLRTGYCAPCTAHCDRCVRLRLLRASSSTSPPRSRVPVCDCVPPVPTPYSITISAYRFDGMTMALCPPSSSVQWTSLELPSSRLRLGLTLRRSGESGCGSSLFLDLSLLFSPLSRCGGTLQWTVPVYACRCTIIHPRTHAITSSLLLRTAVRAMARVQEPRRPSSAAEGRVGRAIERLAVAHSA